MSSSVLAASSIDFGFNLMEDRMLVRCRAADGQQRRLCLTRRLTKAFLLQFGAMLVSTTAKDGLPADQRETLAMFEHIDALHDSAALTRDREAATAPSGEATEPAEDGAPPEAEPVTLVTRIDVTPHPDRFDMLLYVGEGCAVVLPLTRADAHRLLSVLYRTAEQGGWDFAGQVGWIGEGERLSRGSTVATTRKH